jgi:type 1 fimbriae regulatory protein FimB/type 1 fimbriae regulatory protein FimE
MTKKKPAAKRPAKAKVEKETSLLHLTEDQVARLRESAGKTGRNRHRDSTMILVAFRHGLRVSELVRLKWDQVNLKDEDLWVIRRKGSKDSMHYLEDDEVAALKKLPGEHKGWVFRSERKGNPRMTESGFRKMVQRAGADANFDFIVHPHMLRHGCGFYKHKKGWPTIDVKNWLGHVDIRHTVHYVAEDSEAFRRARAREKKV